MKNRDFRAITTICITCAAALILFCLLNRYDNKYNMTASISQDGAVLVPASQDGDGAPDQGVS